MRKMQASEEDGASAEGVFLASRIEWYRFEGGGRGRKIGAWTEKHPVPELLIEEGH